jgi:hypothetical protein
MTNKKESRNFSVALGNVLISHIYSADNHLIFLGVFNETLDNLFICFINSPKKRWRANMVIPARDSMLLDLTLIPHNFEQYPLDLMKMDCKTGRQRILFVEKVKE